MIWLIDARMVSIEYGDQFHITVNIEEYMPEFNISKNIRCTPDHTYHEQISLIQTVALNFWSITHSRIKILE